MYGIAWPVWCTTIALEQILPAKEVYFMPVTSSKLPTEPKKELILYSAGRATSAQVESAIFGFSPWASFMKSSEFFR